jgi:hypothetical protein
VHEGPKHNQLSAHKQYPITCCIFFQKKKSDCEFARYDGWHRFQTRVSVRHSYRSYLFFVYTCAVPLSVCKYFCVRKFLCRLFFFVPHSSSRLLRHTLASAVHWVGLFCSTDAVTDEPWRTGNFTAGVAGLCRRSGRRIHFQCVL